MKKISKLLFAIMLLLMSVLTVPVEAEAAKTYRDDWYTYSIAGATASDDVVVVKRNPDKLYTGVCNYSDSSSDSVEISGYVPSQSGSTMLTKINTTVSAYRQPGDVQTFQATTSNENARFNLKITCENGSATNKGYVYWIYNG